MQYRWERWLGHLVGFEEMYVLLNVVKERRPEPSVSPPKAGPPLAEGPARRRRTPRREAQETP
jgi:hypothetical protein